MTLYVSPEELEAKVDLEGVTNDTELFDTFSLEDIMDFLKESGIISGSEFLGCYTLDDLKHCKAHSFPYVPEAALFGGQSSEQLLATCLALVDTRTFKPTTYNPNESDGWTKLVSLTQTGDQDDFIFGLFGGGLNKVDVERPVAILRVGMGERHSSVVSFSGSYEGLFVECISHVDGVEVVEIWYGGVSRNQLHMACLNSTTKHQYFDPDNSVAELTATEQYVVDCNVAVLKSKFDVQAQVLKDELESLRATLASLKNPQ